MIKINIAYVRVSTIEQNEDRQIETLKKYNIEKWYIEKVSAKNADRKELNNMIEFARDGDTVFISDLSRIARSVKDLLNIIDTLEKKNVKLVSSKEDLNTSTAVGELMVTLIAAINQFERKNMLERQREGIALAKAKGKYKGRNKKEINNDFIELYEKWKRREITATSFSKEIGMSRATLYSRIKEHEENIKGS